EPDPPLIYKIIGGNLVDGDTLNGSLVRDPGENVGSYAIHQGTLTTANNPNYAITYTQTGQFVIGVPAEVARIPRTWIGVCLNPYNHFNPYPTDRLRLGDIWLDRWEFTSCLDYYRGRKALQYIRTGGIRMPEAQLKEQDMTVR